jgi:hypothetical protein|tara:strand:+ start:75 stop:254 length:180 start_codon:yes stop_codon:yes gene_type:complete
MDIIAMITEAIVGIVVIGLMTFFIYGMYLLETDKQARWDERQKKKLDRSNPDGRDPNSK